MHIVKYRSPVVATRSLLDRSLSISPASTITFNSPISGQTVSTVSLSLAPLCSLVAAAEMETATVTRILHPLHLLPHPPTTLDLHHHLTHLPLPRSLAPAPHPRRLLLPLPVPLPPGDAAATPGGTTGWRSAISLLQSVTIDFDFRFYWYVHSAVLLPMVWVVLINVGSARSSRGIEIMILLLGSTGHA